MAEIPPVVAILMGSDSDLPTMAECARVLELEPPRVARDLQLTAAAMNHDRFLTLLGELARFHSEEAGK